MTKKNKTKKKKYRVIAARNVNTFSYISSVSKECLERAEAQTAGRDLVLSASMVFSAFKLEAFLNHIGEINIPIWAIIERKLSPFEKLDIIFQHLAMVVDFGQRPFQTIKEMFQFRDALAHGKSEEVCEEYIEIKSKVGPRSLPKTNWEKEISIGNAKKYIEDTDKIIRLLFEKLGLNPDEAFVRSEHSFQRSQILD